MYQIISKNSGDVCYEKLVPEHYVKYGRANGLMEGRCADSEIWTTQTGSFRDNETRGGEEFTFIATVWVQPVTMILI